MDTSVRAYLWTFWLPHLPGCRCACMQPQPDLRKRGKVAGLLRQLAGSPVYVASNSPDALSSSFMLLSRQLASTQLPSWLTAMPVTLSCRLSVNMMPILMSNWRTVPSTLPPTTCTLHSQNGMLVVHVQVNPAHSLISFARCMYVQVETCHWQKMYKCNGSFDNTGQRQWGKAAGFAAACYIFSKSILPVSHSN